MIAVRLALVACLGTLLLGAACGGEEQSAPAGAPGRYLLDPWSLDTDLPIIGMLADRLRGDLEIRPDGTWRSSVPELIGDRQGRWTREGERLRLTTTVPDERGEPREEVLEGRLEQDRVGVSFPAPHLGGALVAAFRRPASEMPELLGLSPSERAALVRSRLPEPEEGVGFRFDFVEYSLSGRVEGRVAFVVEPTELEGRPAWLFQTSSPGPDGAGTPSKVWLGRDLRLLREESDETVLVAVEGGFEVGPAPGRSGEKVFHPADPAATAAGAGHLLFLRGCPAETLEYELPVWEERSGRVRPCRLQVKRTLVALADGAPCRKGLLGTIRTDTRDVSGGEGFFVRAGDRTPVLYSMNAISGVGAASFTLVNPEVVGPREHLGRPTGPGPNDDAGTAFAVGALLGDEEAVQGAVDWEEVLAAAADDFAPDPPPSVAEAREALRRYRRALLPAEVDWMLAAVRAGPETTRDGDQVEVRMRPVGADFDCRVRSGDHGPKVVRLRPSLLRGERHDRALHPDEGPAAPTRNGARFWIWARAAHGRSSQSVLDLDSFGPSAVPALVELAVDGCQTAVNCLVRRGPELLPTLLDAHSRAGAEGRSRIAGGIVKLLRERVPSPETLERATPVLFECLEGSGGRTAASLLAGRGEAVVDGLVGVLTTGSLEGKANALEALERIGPAAGAAAPAVEALLEDRNEPVRGAAERALRMIRGPQLRLRVVPEGEGREPASVRVTLYRRGKPVEASSARSPGTAPRGECRLTGYEPGTYDLLVEARGYAPAVLEQVELAGGLTDLGAVQLSDGETIVFEVGPLPFEPKSELFARAVRRGRVPCEVFAYSGEPDADGGRSISLPPLGEGSYLVTIWCPPGEGQRGRELFSRLIEAAGDGLRRIRVEPGELPAPWDEDLAIYLGCKFADGKGAIVQVDGAGKILGTVALPGAPYGLARGRGDALVAAIPGASALVVSVDRDGGTQTLLEGRDKIRAPIAVAVERSSGDVLIADNDVDVLLLLPGGRAKDAREMLRIEGNKDRRQNLSVAFARDGRVLLGASEPPGIFRFRRGAAELGDSVLPGDGRVAADPESDRWAASQGEELRVYGKEGGPRILATGRVHSLCFAGSERVVFTRRYSGSTCDVHVADLGTGAIQRRFRWTRSVVVSLAVGPRMPW